MECLGFSFSNFSLGITPRYIIAPVHIGSINPRSESAVFCASSAPLFSASLAARFNNTLRVAECMPSAPSNTSHVAVVPSSKCNVIGDVGSDEGGRV